MKKQFVFYIFWVLISRFNAQTYTIINSPDPVTYTSISDVNAPNGHSVHTTFYGVYYVDPMDLAIPSSSIDISSFGFAYTSTLLNTPASGSLTVYLSNTSDGLYAKGNSWTTAIAGMTQVYNGILNIPTGTVEVDVDLNFPTNFNYGGNGLYVAFSYTGITFDNTTFAYNKCCYQPPLPTNTLGVIADSQIYTDLNNMYKSISRPVFRFGLANPIMGIEEDQFETEFNIFPNPCSDKIMLQSDCDISLFEVNVYDVYRKLVVSQLPFVPIAIGTAQGDTAWLTGENKYSLDIKDLENGIYFLEIRSKDRACKKKILVVK